MGLYYVYDSSEFDKTLSIDHGPANR